MSTHNHSFANVAFTASEIGAALTNFEVTLDGQTFRPMRQSAQNLTCGMDGAAYGIPALFGRLPATEDGKKSTLHFLSTEFLVEHPRPNALHWKGPDIRWNARRANGKLIFDAGPDILSEGYPFRIGAQIMYEPLNNGFDVDLLTANHGHEPAIVSDAWHPFWRERLIPSNPDDQIRLRLRGKAVLPYEGEVALPTGRPIAIPPDWDYSEIRTVTKGQPLDNSYIGVDPEVWLEWPASDLRVKIRTNVTNVHVFTGFMNGGNGAVAVEQTNGVAGAFELLKKRYIPDEAGGVFLSGRSGCQRVGQGTRLKVRHRFERISSRARN